MNYLTLLGVIFLIVGVIISIVIIHATITRTNGDEKLLKNYIDHLCWGAFIGALISWGVMFLSFSDATSDAHRHYYTTNISDSIQPNPKIIIQND